jgi:hypothetical protein
MSYMSIISSVIFIPRGIVMTYCHQSLKKGLINICCQICLLILSIDFQPKSPSAKYVSPTGSPMTYYGSKQLITPYNSPMKRLINYQQNFR